MFYVLSAKLRFDFFLTQIQEIIRIAAAATAKSIETKNSTSVKPVLSPALNRAPSFSSTSTGASPAAPSLPVNPIPFCRSAAGKYSVSHGYRNV